MSLVSSSFLLCCRLQDQGVRVLVERAVNRLEFPEFDVFDPAVSGEWQTLTCVGRQAVVHPV